MAGSVYDRRVRPSGWWYAAAAGIALGGILAGLAVAAKGVDNALEAVGSFDRASVPGVVEVTIDDPGGYSIYQEFPGASDRGGPVDPPDVLVAGPAGDLVDVDSYGTFVSYDQGSFEGRGIYTFRADQPGTYRIVATGAPDSTIAVGPGMGDLGAQAVAGAFDGFVGGVMLAGIGIVTGIVVAIAIGVARGRSRRRRVIHVPIPLAPPGPAVATSPRSVGPGWSYGTPGWSSSPAAATAGAWSAPVAGQPGGWPGTATSPVPFGGPTAPAVLAVAAPPGPVASGAAVVAPAVPVVSGAAISSPQQTPVTPAAPGVAAASGGPVMPVKEPGTRVMATAGAVAAAQAGAGEPTSRGPAPTLVEPGTPDGSSPTEPLSRPGDPQSLRSPVDWSRSDIELPWDGERSSD